MNLILLFEQDFINSQHVVLSDHRLQHIQQTLRAKTGDSLRLGLLNGDMGHGIITALDSGSATIRVELKEKPPAKLPLTIVLALPRPKMLKRILRSTAELGIEELIIINSYKVEKSFWQSPALQAEKIRGYLIDGLQQSKDTVLPKVQTKTLFKPFVEDELPALVHQKRGLLAHPAMSESCPLAIDEPALLAIGPEGGFTHYEVDKLLDAGLTGIQLGERILRVENAVTALTSKLYR